MARNSTRKTTIALAIASALTLTHQALRADDTYIGLNTTWSNNAAWSNTNPPIPTDNVLVLPTVPSGTNTLSLDSDVTVGNLFLGASGNGTAILSLQNNSLSASSINLLSAALITGSGTLQARISNKSSITTNATTTLNMTGSSNNSGTLSATAGGDLQLNGANVNIGLLNTFGTLSASGNDANPAYLDVANLSISGGNITTSGANSAVRITSTSVLANLTISGNLQSSAQLALQNVNFSSGSLNITSSLILAGNITNNGIWNCASPIGNSGFVSLNGNGTINLNGANWSNGATIGAGQTIQGNGNISSFVSLTNNGNITANSPSGLTIGAPVIYNTGAMSAIGSTLLFNLPTGGTVYNNGSISASGENGTYVYFKSCNIVGGQLNTDAAAGVHLDGACSLTNVQLNGNLLTSTISNITFSNTTLNGRVAQNNIINLSGTITNNANWTTASPIQIQGNVSLLGNGTLSLTASGNMLIGTVSIGAATANASLTNGAGHTIEGTGFIGLNNMTALVNNGTLDANSSTLGIGTPLTSTGTLAVESGATMNISRPFTSTGITRVSGTLIVGTLGTSTAADITGGGNMSINTGTTANPGLVSNALQLNSLNISNGSVQIRPNTPSTATSELQHLSLSSSNNTFTSSLDLTTNSLILQITSPSTLSTTQSEIAAGTLFTSIPNLSLALIDNSSLTTPFTTFAGQPVSPSSLLITPALPGDTNLDNTVDLSDLSTILNNFGTTTPNWTSGNFDHTPTIDLTDLSDVLNNFGTSNPNPSALQITDYRLPAPAPEPATLLLAAPLLFHRTRKIRNREHICART